MFVFESKRDRMIEYLEAALVLAEGPKGGAIRPIIKAALEQARTDQIAQDRRTGLAVTQPSQNT
jgi:hypothetical protein